MEKVKVQKGTQVKVIPIEYKKDYICAGWSEYQKPKKIEGVHSSNINGKNRNKL